jgi:hypothetical protein
MDDWLTSTCVVCLFIGFEQVMSALPVPGGDTLEIDYRLRGGSRQGRKSGTGLSSRPGTAVVPADAMSPSQRAHARRQLQSAPTGTSNTNSYPFIGRTPTGLTQFPTNPARDSRALFTIFICTILCRRSHRCFGRLVISVSRNWRTLCFVGTSRIIEMRMFDGLSVICWFF